MSYVNSVFVAGRGGGKTHQLIGWFLRGKPIQNEPTWSRLILCSDTTRAWQLMRQVASHRTYLTVCQLHPDFPMRMRHAVRSADRTVLDGVHPSVELGVDDVEDVLQTMLRTTLPVQFLTVTGSIHQSSPSIHSFYEEEVS